MKILVCGDVHWSQYSSIVRGRGEKYSKRLENLIKSVNWVEQLAWSCGCEAVINLGDFFDSTQLSAEEVSALKEVQWAPIAHVFITGNHETNVSSLEFATNDLFNIHGDFVVISKPECFHIEGANVEFAYIPYILERDRQPIEYYLTPYKETRIMFSHNDLKDIQYGAFLSTEGFTVEEIENNCDLCFNGHIHHCSQVSPKIINSGNLTGQNFTEDAYKYSHCVQIFDTDTLHVDFYENPHAMNFYRIDFTSLTESDAVKALEKIKTNAVLTVKTNYKSKDHIQELLNRTDISEKILQYRITVEPELTEVESTKNEFETVDHLKQFENYVARCIGSNDIIKEELSIVLR